MTYRHYPPSSLSGRIPEGSWGQIVVKDGPRYQITNDDVLWLARMVYGEGGSDPGAVLWVVAQRYMGLPQFRNSSSYPTMAAFVRAWSEPLMAHRTSTGSHCLANPASDRCQPPKLARRELIQSIPWDPPYPSSKTVQGATSRLSVSKWETVKRLTRAWAHATVPNSVPGAVDMAASRVTPNREGGRPPQVVKRADGNTFYSWLASRSWPANYVTIVDGGRTAGVTAFSRVRRTLMIAGPITLGLMAAGAVYVAVKRKK